MTRFMLMVLCALTCALCVPVSAEDPPKKLTPEERKELEAKWRDTFIRGSQSFQAGKYTEATATLESALETARRLYPKDEYPDGHANLANSLNAVAVMYNVGGKLAAAEPLYTDALAMRKRLFKGDHPHVAQSLNNLAGLYRKLGKFAEAEALYKDAAVMLGRLHKGDHSLVAQNLGYLGTLYLARGEPARAEPFFADALAMRKRLHKVDHPDLATSLNNLALVYEEQGKLTEAERLYVDALEMTKRLCKDDHPDLVASLSNLAGLHKTRGKLADAEPLYRDALAMAKRMSNGDDPLVADLLDNLATLYADQGRSAEAEPLFKDALAMRKRLFKGDYPDVASSLNNLAARHWAQGRLTEAESLFKDALAMRKRLFKGDHPVVAQSLSFLAYTYHAQGKFADAAPLFADALAMSARLTAGHAEQKSEGEALTRLAAQPLTRDMFLTHARAHGAAPGGPDPAAAYPAMWAAKGNVARVFEGRQLRARAAATDPALASVVARLGSARRDRAELLLGAPTADRATLKKREEALEALDRTIEELTGALRENLPTVARAAKLKATTEAELRKALPTDAAVIDFHRYTFFEYDNNKPSDQKEVRTSRYLAFVVTRDKVAWVDLDTAAKIEPAIDAWRAAITGGKEIPAAIPAKVRELVWDKVRKELPANTKTVYICPDAALCRVPFAALPGDKPGTILLEDFALATVPHAPFLLDKLWPQDPLKNPPTGALVVGGVKYDAEPAPPAMGAVASRGDPLVKPDAKLAWAFLANTVGEARGVAEAAARKKLTPTRIDGDKATPAAVLSALPKAKVAHFATHGFFADASFRSVFQLDPKDYEMRGGERVGRAANSPLVMTGLVFAGANNPKTAGRGIVTGEALIDLDLGGLELAVLSACETGIGDVAGGEGTFGLQRAFHYAGTTNVVASLWKVPDAPTAALMALFYRNLWEQNLSPMESLRQAQLELYKNPAKIPELAKGFRGKFEEVPGMGGEVDIKPTKDGKAHPLLWAAFTLSGPGR